MCHNHDMLRWLKEYWIPILLCAFMLFWSYAAMRGRAINDKRLYEKGYEEGFYDGYWKSQGERGVY
jgi:hypothetical protein